MSTTRMLVLGVVRMFQPVHGYDVRRELMTWHASEWANAAPGSIYSALKSLTKEGSLEVVGTKQVGGRPERTTFRITARGEQELSELLRGLWWHVEPLVDPMVAAVSLLGFMDRGEAVRALEGRVGVIEANVAHATLAASSIEDGHAPAHVREMIALMSARALAEVGWARAFAERLKKGDYSTLGDAPWAPSKAGIAKRQSQASAKRGLSGGGGSGSNQAPMRPAPAKKKARTKGA